VSHKHNNGETRKAIQPKWDENNTSVRPPNLPSASCDLHLDLDPHGW